MKKVILIFALVMTTIASFGQAWITKTINEDALANIPKHTEYVYTSDVCVFSFTSLNGNDFIIQFKSVILYENNNLFGDVSSVLVGFYDESNNLIKKQKCFFNNNANMGSPNVLTGLNEKNRKYLKEDCYKGVGKYSSFQLATNQELKEKKLREENAAESLYKLSEPLLNTIIDTQREINDFLLNKNGYIRLIVDTYGDGQIDVSIKCIN